MVRRDKPPSPGDERRSARAAALACVARRELSTAQLRQRLGARGFTPGIVDETIDRLVLEGAVDDGRAARALARTEARKHRGPARIRQALERAGVTRDRAREAVAELFADASESDAIERAIERRWRQRGLNPSDPADLRRVRGYLLRQGFSASAVGEVLIRLRRRRAAGGSEPEP
jgi:regulatory protein